MNYEVADGKFFLEYRVVCLRKKKHGRQLKDENSFVQSRGRKSEPKNMKRRKLMGSKTIFTKKWKQWFLHFADELVVFCPLTSFQEDVYQTLLQNSDVELITKKNFPCDCGSRVDRGKCCYKVNTIECAQYTVTC